jgi:two-component system, NtrC family, response regulator AtoC
MAELDYTRFPIVVVDDEQDNLDAFRFVFRKSFALRYANGGAQALDLLNELDPAAIISDQRMPGMSGIELLRHAVGRRPDAAGILLTAYTDMPLLLEAINSGAVYRYVQKPWDSKELSVILRQSIERFHNLRENARLREQLTRYAGYLEAEQQDPLDFGELLGNDPAMQGALRRIDQLSNSTQPVLVFGEPGTEKGLFARALHVGSSREGRPYVQVPCSRLTVQALLQELFGWEKGAFEGALGSRPGRMELADGGTLVLSELSELPANVADALEKAVERNEVCRVGGVGAAHVDVRLVVTTRMPPETFARGSPFGARFTDSIVTVPPLRERVSELPRICERLLHKLARRHGSPAIRFTSEALALLVEYPWPGNMRELETVIERAVLLCSDQSIGPACLGTGTTLGSNAVDRASSLTGAEGAQSFDLPGQLDDIERRELCAALERCGGNKAEVARMLGIHRTTLYYRLKRLGIDVQG